MKTRVNLRCASSSCRWTTSRALRADDVYGQCALCGQNLVRPRTRKFFRRAQRAPAPLGPADQTRYHDQYATWPELVAAELDRRERRAAK